MSDYQDYSTSGNHHQGKGNGYDRLDGDWATYYKVAKGFLRRVKPEDRQDFLHDLLLAMARVKASYTAKGKELTTGGLVRIAQYEVADYWRKFFNRKNGIDCGRCSKPQREKCKEWFLYGDNDCPKAIKAERLDELVEDGNGDSTPLHELIADDNAVDVVAMLDARFTLNSYPRKALLIAYKRYAGYSLDKRERAYLSRFSRRIKNSNLGAAFSVVSDTNIVRG